MGTRRKRPLTVYFPLGDPVIEYLDRFKDKSQEALRLLQIGFQQVSVTVSPSVQALNSHMTVTDPSIARTGEKPTVTEPPAHTPRRGRVTVSVDDLDPAWDE